MMHALKGANFDATQAQQCDSDAAGIRDGALHGYTACGVLSRDMVDQRSLTA